MESAFEAWPLRPGTYEETQEAAFLANEAFGWIQSRGHLAFFFAQASLVEVSTESLGGTLTYQDMQAFVAAQREEGGTLILVQPSRKDIDAAIKIETSPLWQARLYRKTQRF